MSAAPASRWRAADAAQIDWRAWGDEIVVYVRDTANTHLLDGVVRAVFAALLAHDRAASAEELFARVVPEASHAPIPPSEVAALENVLSSLEALRLARRSPC